MYVRNKKFKNGLMKVKYQKQMRKKERQFAAIIIVVVHKNVQEDVKKKKNFIINLNDIYIIIYIIFTKLNIYIYEIK